MSSISRNIFWYLVSFTFTSLIDVVWHILLFGKIYAKRMQDIAPMQQGQMAIKAIPGLLSQVLVVSMMLFLVSYGQADSNLKTGALIGAAAGVLAISVYGLVNYALVKNWTLDITILEVVWGPILGGLSGLFAVWMKTIIFKGV